MLRLVFVALVWCAVPVSAQEGAPEAADDLIAQAVSEYNAGRYAEAYALFRRAQERQESARTLRGIGMAAFEMRDYAAAVRSLRQAMDHEVRPLTDEQREHTRGLLQQAGRYVGQFRVGLSPDEALLTVDGRPAELSDEGVLLLSLGTHELRAECPECEPWSRRLTVSGGEQADLPVELARVDPAEPAEPAPPDPQPEPEPEAPDLHVDPAGAGPSIAPFLLIGTGGAMIIAAGVTGALALSKRGELDDGCVMSICESTLVETRDDAQTFAAVTDALWIGGMVVAGAGLVWWLLGESDAEQPIARATCGSSGCRADLRVTLP